MEAKGPSTSSMRGGKHQRGFPFRASIVSDRGDQEGHLVANSLPAPGLTGLYCNVRGSGHLNHSVVWRMSVFMQMTRAPCVSHLLSRDCSALILLKATAMYHDDVAGFWEHSRWSLVPGRASYNAFRYYKYYDQPRPCNTADDQWRHGDSLQRFIYVLVDVN
jgi:hypothetical protein